MTGEQAADRLILLAKMRTTSARLRLYLAVIEEVAVMLKAARISAQGAVFWLEENGVADLVIDYDTGVATTEAA